MEIKIDPTRCLFCQLDCIFPVEGLTKHEIKQHDHQARISRLPVEQKLIYVFAELYSKYTHMVNDIREVFSADNVNEFFSHYLPNTTMKFELSGIQLGKIEKTFRKVVNVYVANGLISEDERRTFFEQMLDLKAIKTKYREIRSDIARELSKMDVAWFDPDEIRRKEDYEASINAAIEQHDAEQAAKQASVQEEIDAGLERGNESGGRRFSMSSFAHELAENIRRTIMTIVRNEPDHSVGHLDDIIYACAELANFGEEIAKAIVRRDIPLKKLPVLFHANLFSPDNRHIIAESSFFLFPLDTSIMVADLLQEHLTRDCKRCDFKCLREPSTWPDGWKKDENRLG
jgi:polyhydroxyalkanoate synthesis regulator phasin